MEKIMPEVPPLTVGSMLNGDWLNPSAPWRAFQCYMTCALFNSCYCMLGNLRCHISCCFLDRMFPQIPNRSLQCGLRPSMPFCMLLFVRKVAKGRGRMEGSVKVLTGLVFPLVKSKRGPESQGNLVTVDYFIPSFLPCTWFLQLFPRSYKHPATRQRRGLLHI